MSGFVVRAVDERDSCWEQGEPRFRVCLHDGGPDATGGTTWTYDIEGGDVLQVIDWAQREAAGARTYAVALVLDDPTRACADQPDGRGLIWLVGMDGNDTTASDSSAEDVQRRMVRRRVQPVGIPTEDTHPEPLG